LAEPIALAVEGLPRSVTVTPLTMAANQPAVDLAFKADAPAAIDVSRLTIRGTAKTGSGEVTRTAVLPGVRGGAALDSVLLAVTLTTPFKVVGEYDMRWAPRGSVHSRHYRIERGGFDGPLEVSLTDRQARHLQGVTGPTITVPPGVSEFDYPITLPPWMEMGRTCRVCVMAAGVVKDAAGNEHTVSFSSVQQNEQVVAVIEPGRLDVQAERTSVVAEAGGTVSVPVRVSRGKGLTGAVKLELLVPGHLHGVSAEPVEVPADGDKTTLTIRFAAGARGPFNVPLVIRASVPDGRGLPVVAQTKLEVLPPGR